MAKASRWAARQCRRAGCKPKNIAGTAAASSASHSTSDVNIGQERGCIESALPTPGNCGLARSREISHKMAAKTIRSRKSSNHSIELEHVFSYARAQYPNAKQRQYNLTPQNWVKTNLIASIYGYIKLPRITVYTPQYDKSSVGITQYQLIKYLSKCELLRYNVKV